MKITIHPNTGELSFDIDPENKAEIEQTLIIAKSLRNGHETSFSLASDEDLDLISPAPSSTNHEHIAAGLQSAEQLETWMYLRRNDRQRGISLASLARRFKLSSTAASARCSTLVRLGYAVRISNGYYRAIVPSEN